MCKRTNLNSMSIKANRMFSYVMQTYLFLPLGLKFVLVLGVDYNAIIASQILKCSTLNLLPLH